MRHSRARYLPALGLLTLLLVTGCSSSARSTSSFGPGPPATEPPSTVPASSLHGIHKIRHVIVIMQENRSFDSYFGTYPGADGIPMRHGVPTVCLPDPHLHTCVKPYHDAADHNRGGPHEHADALGDINRGRMDGFIR